MVLVVPQVVQLAALQVWRQLAWPQKVLPGVQAVVVVLLVAARWPVAQSQVVQLATRWQRGAARLIMQERKHKRREERWEDLLREPPPEGLRQKGAARLVMQEKRHRREERQGA